jgi:hypothetical protein
MVKMADIKVRFLDGEEVIYENAPASITADEVIARAQKEFATKQIASVEKLKSAEPISKPVVVEKPLPARGKVPTVNELIAPTLDKLSGGEMVAGDDFLRQLGLFGRYATGAATAIPEMVSDPFSNIVNAIAGREVMTPIAKTRQQALDALNVPKPQTPQERIVGDITQAGLSLAAPAGVAQKVQAVPQALKSLLLEAPTVQSASTIAAPFIASTAREYGDVGEAGQIGLGLMGSIGVGGAAAGAPRTAQSVANIVKPFTEAGREVITGNVLRQLARDPEQAIEAGLKYKPSIPGYSPTTAQATRDVGLIGAETTVRGLDQTGKFGKQIGDANKARMVILDRMAKDKDALALAVTKREDVTAPLREQAFAKSTVSPETFQSAITLTVNKKIDDILASPAGARGTVEDTMNWAKNELRRGTNPERLYEVRKDLRMAAQGLLKKEGSNFSAAKSQLEQVIRAVDDTLEATAPGYKDYLNKYAQASRGIERLEAAQDFRGKVLTTTPDPSNAGEYLISQPKFTTAIRNAQKDTNLSKTQLAVLEKVSKDLDDGVLNRAVKVPGSDTFKNLSTANIIGGIIGKQIYGEVSPGLSKLVAPMNWLYNGTDDAIRELLVDAMLDPKLASKLMAVAKTTTIEPLSNELKRKALSLGYGAAFGLE